MMKKSMFCRITSAFLAVVMVFLMVPVSAFTVFAAPTTTPGMANIEKYRLDIINGTSSENLLSYINTQFDKMTIENNVATGKSTTQAVLSGMSQIANVVGAGCKILSVFKVPGMEETSKIFEAIGTITGAFVEDDSTDILMEQLNKIQSVINDRFDELKVDLDNHFDAQQKYISDTVSNASQKILDRLDMKSYLHNLQSFYTDAFGFDSNGDPMGYSDWKKDLYVSLDDLLQAENNGIISKSYYDSLYAMAIKSEILYKNFMGYGYAIEDAETFSLQEGLYQYYILSQHSSYNDTDFQLSIEKCIEYSQDWYSMYEYSQMCLNLCYIYQLQNLIEQYGVDKLGGAQYKLFNSEEKVVSYNHEILPFLQNPHKNLNTVTAEMAAYYARILNLDESYIYESGYESGDLKDHYLYKVPYQEIFEYQSFNSVEYYLFGNTGINFYVRTNNQVSAGDTLYLNVMPEVFESLFGVGNFYFRIDNEGCSRTTVDNAGVVKVNISEDAEIGESGSFTATLYYNNGYEPINHESDRKVYEMTFEIVKRQYAGGLGTKTAPFLISEWDHLVKLATQTDEVDHCEEVGIYFSLVNDIGIAAPVEFSGIPSFKGTFDGNGYSIHSFSIKDTETFPDNDTEQTIDEKNIGFFHTNDGTIINLTIGNKDISTLEDHSVVIESKATETSKESHLSIGAIAGINRGTIYNCFVDNVLVNGELYDNNNNQHAYCNVGGIAGLNNGIIEQCSVESSTIKSYLTAKKNSGDNNYATAGGIVGKNEATLAKDKEGELINGIVKNSVSFNNKPIKADARGDGTGDNGAFPEACVGGLIGDSRNGRAENSVTYNNTLEIYGSEGGNTSSTILKGLYIGVTKETFNKCAGEKYIDIVYTNCFGDSATGVAYNPDNSLLIPEAKVMYMPFGDYFIIDASSNSTKECSQITDASHFSSKLDELYGGKKPDYWILDQYGYPTLKSTSDTPQPKPETPVGGLVTENIPMHYQGETNFKYTPKEGEQIIYPLSSHRIDTSVVGTTNVIVLTQDAARENIYRKDVIQVTVKEAEVEGIFIYIKPTKTEYLVGDTIDMSGLILFAEYESGVNAPISVESCNVQYDFSKESKGSTVIISYNGFSDDYEVNITCGHKNTTPVNETKPTCNNVGYTAGTYCNDCQTYISGHEEIPVLSTHPYGEWTKHDEKQHVRSCECGEKEYKDHVWDEGVITTPATPENDGVKTYTCLDCKATYEVNLSVYSITFNTDGGTPIETLFLTSGTAVIAPANPTREGYTFAGWDKEIPATMPAENITITALWTSNTYTVIWIVDGNEYKKTEVVYGNAITLPEAPVKAQSGCTAYTFAGWAGYTDDMTMPAANQTFTAEFTESASHTSEKFTYVNNANGTHTKKHECCGVVVNATEACADAAGDQNHACDFCGAADISAHNGGTATCKTLAACAECGQSYGSIDPTKHESVEITYTDVQKTTHDEYFACCNALKLDNAAHIFADHLCACGASEYLIVTFMNGDAQYFKSETKYNTALDISYLAAPEAPKGYAFAGWYTEDGTCIENGMTITESMVVYAKFVAGDADGNGKIEKKDAENILKYIVGQNVPVNDATALDVNRDGKVTVVDVITLLLYLAGKIELIN